MKHGSRPAWRLAFVPAVICQVCFLSVNTSAETDASISLNSSNPSLSWKVKPQAEVGADSVNVIRRGYHADQWVPAVVPGNIFTSYVEAGLEKDPNFGDNIYKVDKTKYDRNFWYRTEFSVPAAMQGRRVWLHFEGVNRAAEVFCNGSRLGRLDGFMQRGAFDVTSLVSFTQPNALALLVILPEAPLVNWASPTYLSAASWDWMPYVPGLLMGISDDVYLRSSGDVTISDPWIRSDLPATTQANLSIELTVNNHSAQSRNVTVAIAIEPGAITLNRDIILSPKETRTIKFDRNSNAALSIANPRLWWPNGYGEPNLYQATLSASVDGTISNELTENFGIRKYSYDTDGDVLHFWINGVKLFVKGGNWGMSEYLLRCRGAEYDTKLRFHREMHLNMIRNWVGSVTDEEFYDACDRYGLMVWDDFWLNSLLGTSRTPEVFNENGREKIRRLRNHPCIALWCGMNENTPPPVVSDSITAWVARLDGDDRRYQPNSRAGSLSGSGPWVNMEPKTYFNHGPGAFGSDGGQGMRSEIGTAVFTTFESFKKFMPQESWWPRNEMWNLHFFGPGAANAGPDTYESSVNNRYGTATGIEDFCRKAQLLNIETNQAMFEGWQQNMWNNASGILLWMSQSAYPSLVWQTYDYYYDLNGAYWGVKKACEPLHIQWNCADNTVNVVNTTGQDESGLTAEVSVYNSDGAEVSPFRTATTVNAPVNKVTYASTINFDPGNLAFKKRVVASSNSASVGSPEAAVDGSEATRWASEASDNQWIYVDLGSSQDISGVSLVWEGAYGKAYRIQTSGDAATWSDVYSTTQSDGGVDRISFTKTTARYVRMLGVQRATMWGYSLWEFRVFNDTPAPQLSDVHFIKLALKNSTGKLVSDNFYWRGKDYLDYRALSSLPQVQLTTQSRISQRNGKYLITATITNPASSPAVAFAIKVDAVKARSGEQILPAFISDGYFSLVKGESRTVTVEFDTALAGGEEFGLRVQPYNGQTGITDAQRKPLAADHRQLVEARQRGSAVAFNMRLQTPGNVTIRMFNVAGRQLTTFTSRNLRRGNHEFVLNDATDNGLRMVTGTYFYAVEIGGTGGESRSFHGQVLYVK